MIKYIITLALIVLSSCSISEPIDETDASDFSSGITVVSEEVSASWIIIEETLEEEIIIEEEKTTHIETPEDVKSLYFTAYAATNDYRLENLYYLVENKEINSVVIDIKEVAWYTSFEIDDSYFSSIKPVSDNTIKDIESLIEYMHEKGIYVIWRIVVFKDNHLSRTRPDLAIKWNYNTSEVWSDFKWNSYLDAWAQEVWQYNSELAVAAYDLWFDEINYDYVRFPSDGYISKAYFPFSNDLINEYGKYWKTKMIDKFATYITTKTKEARPDLKLSADVFGLVTNIDLHSIGQNLETFMINFDYVSPMIYPSHYWAWYLWYSVPDNIPYEIFDDSIKKLKSKIENFNSDLDAYSLSWTTLLISEAYSPEKPIEQIEKLDLNQIRPWLQWFTCTRCKWATAYTRTKFRRQIEALNFHWLDSWFVWSSWSNYYREWYD